MGNISDNTLPIQSFLGCHKRKPFIANDWDKDHYTNYVEVGGEDGLIIENDIGHIFSGFMCILKEGRGRKGMDLSTINVTISFHFK